MAPEPADVAAFLGQSGDPAALELATAHLPVVTAMVRRYVRGGGFTAGAPDDDLAAVIVSATARAVSNPTHAVSIETDDVRIRPGSFDGWTLPELAILHSYRKRAR